MECGKCAIVKPAEEFTVNKKLNCFYPTCTKCYKDDARIFWATKQYKVCHACDRKRNLRCFTRDADNIPYATCIDCFDKKVEEMYEANKAEKRRVEAMERAIEDGRYIFEKGRMN